MAQGGVEGCFELGRVGGVGGVGGVKGVVEGGGQHRQVNLAN